MEVIFTSSPNIPEGGTTVYNCSTNNSAVSVIAHGAGTTISSPIPGLVNPFNNTEVWCYASGSGFGDVSPSPVITDHLSDQDS